MTTVSAAKTTTDERRAEALMGAAALANLGRAERAIGLGEAFMVIIFTNLMFERG